MHKKLNIDSLRNSILKERITWRKHVLVRLLQRRIKHVQVLEIVLKGECIKEYYDDKPFVSGLFLGFIEEKPIHVVASYDELNDETFIITAYEPSLNIFEDNYRTRRL
jgi:hypothetical protein